MSDDQFHFKFKMPSDGQERTQRRAEAIATAIKEAASDPLTVLRMAFGRAYSDCHNKLPRDNVIRDLRAILSDPTINLIAISYRRKLSEIPSSRDYIGKFQLELLDEALIPEEGPPDAA